MRKLAEVMVRKWEHRKEIELGKVLDQKLLVHWWGPRTLVQTQTKKSKLYPIGITFYLIVICISVTMIVSVK